MEIATSLSLLAMTYGGHRPHFYRENVVDTHLKQGICHTFLLEPWKVFSEVPLTKKCAESLTLVVIGAVDIVGYDADVTFLNQQVVSLRGVARVALEVSHHHV